MVSAYVKALGAFTWKQLTPKVEHQGERETEGKRCHSNERCGETSGEPISGLLIDTFAWKAACCEVRVRVCFPSVSRVSAASTMAGLAKNVANSIWHAFHALATDKPDSVSKSKLKVRKSPSNYLLPKFKKNDNFNYSLSSRDFVLRNGKLQVDFHIAIQKLLFVKHLHAL